MAGPRGRERRWRPSTTACAAVALCLSVLALCQTYLLYPLTLLVGGRDDDPSSPGWRPSVTLVIAAYNEAEVIATKIENSLALEYPDLEIVVFSDGSSDRTDDVVRSYAEEGVRLERIEGRVGKTACQNRVVEGLDSDVVVFSDANGLYEPDAIDALVERFVPGVGCVVGELRYRNGADVEGESVYWRYERLVKRLESRFDSLIGANGSIYAVRRGSYVPLPPGAISDFAEPLAIVSRGERAVYAPDAVAWEHTAGTVGDELDRRIRIVTRSWYTLASFSELLDPRRYPRVSYQLVSHKLLRWLSPVSLAVALLSTLVLGLRSGSRLVRLALVGQVGCYALAAAGWLADRRGIDAPAPLHVPYYFLVANYGMLVGLWNFLTDRRIVAWETADRTAQGEPTNDS
ncbi:glycosyltransferase family 2 protein [Natronorarus salvus]|uniref:glycosyltransferase family 2 protein n=1 Tax=Natronorarus salvus TaxID=3117733 RepID=UPI002F2690EE